MEKSQRQQVIPQQVSNGSSTSSASTASQSPSPARRGARRPQIRELNSYLEEDDEEELAYAFQKYLQNYLINSITQDVHNDLVQVRLFIN